MYSKINGSRKRRLRLGVAASALVGLLLSLLVATPATAEATGTGGLFVPTSSRILDTAAGVGEYNTPMPAGAYRTVKIAGVDGIPDDGSVAAVSLAATVSDITGEGQLLGRPSADSARTMLGKYGGIDDLTTSFSAVLAVSAEGTIDLHAQTAVNLAVDVQGYYTSSTDGTAPGGFVPMNGKRIVDTRSGLGVAHRLVGPGESIEVQVTGTANEVPVGASAAIINMIAVNESDAAGSLTPYPTGEPRTSNAFHYQPGVNTSLQAHVGLSESGKLTIHNALATTHVIVDLQGFFTGAGAQGASFTPASGRVYDSRTSSAGFFTAGETRSIPVAGVTGVPVVGSGIRAAVLTLTSLGTLSGTGRAIVWADGTPQPSTTAISSGEKVMRSNTITVPVGANGAISLQNLGNETNYILDLQGWYAEPIAPTITCPDAYPPGSWTNTLPATDINCVITAPPGLSASATLHVSVDGESAPPTPLSGAEQSHHAVTAPSSAGWHTIEAVVVQSDGTSSRSVLSFGLNDGAPSRLISAIQNAQPEAFTQLTTAHTTNSGPVAIETTDVESPEASATVATDPAVGIELTVGEQTITDPATGDETTTPETTVQAQLPTAATASDARVESTGIVSFDNHNGSHTVTMVKQDASVQNFTVIEHPSAPSSFRYPVEVPDGASLSLDADTGMVWITGSGGADLGGITPAWAKDANGAAVPTHYEVTDGSIVQVIDHSFPTIAYPVVADPYFGRNLFSSTGWFPNGTPGHKGPYVRAMTSTWGRQIQAGIVVPWPVGQTIMNTAGWKELSSRHPVVKTKSTYLQQYHCHVLGAYTPHSGGPAWELEGFRANRPNWLRDGGAWPLRCNW